MADIKISQFPTTVGALTGNEFIPVLQGGVNKKTSLSQIGYAALGFGDMALQNAGAVSIVGGSVNNVSMDGIAINGGQITALDVALAYDVGGTGYTDYTDGQLLIGTSVDGSLVKATLTAGAGVAITNGNGSITIDNSAPDQTVSISAGTGVSVTGTYPNFTVANTAPDQTVSLTGAGTVAVTGSYPNFTITGSGGGSGLTNWTEGVNTSAPNATVPAIYFTPLNAATNADAIVTPKGSGALIAAVPDSTTAGGNKRGTYAVDLQLGARSGAAQVASGDYSATVGGRYNTASAVNSAVFGGLAGSASGNTSTVVGGYIGEALALYSTSVGGYNINAEGDYSVSMGGDSVRATGTFSLALGGSYTNSGGSSTVILGGSQSYAVGAWSCIVGGQTHYTTGDTSVAVGGWANDVTGTKAFTVGGQDNTASGLSSFVLGGYLNYATATASAVINADESSATAIFSTVINAKLSEASGEMSIVSGGNASSRLISGAHIQGRGLASSGYTVGAAQAGSYVLYGQTTTATPATITTVGLGATSAGARITLDSYVTYLFDILVVARRDGTASGESASYRLVGTIGRDNLLATTAILGTVTKTVIYETNAAWDVDVTANTTAGCIDVTVTGEAAKTINWVANVRTVEVTRGT